MARPRAVGERAARVVAAARQHGLRGPDSHGNLRTVCPRCLERDRREEWKLQLKMVGQATDGSPLSPEHDAWYCYRCGWFGYGNLAGALEGSGVAPPAPPDPTLRRSEFEEDVREVMAHAVPLDGRAAAGPYEHYLRGRGMLAAARSAGALACPGGKYRGRVVVPCRPAGGGPWFGFVARAIGREAKLRYLYPRGMDRRSNLWGLDRLRAAGAGEAWLVEGVFDAMPLDPQEGPGAGAAAFGKNVTDEQLEALAALGLPVVVCLDGDAWEEGRVLAQRLRHRAVAARWCRLPPGEDPGALRWRVREFVQPM